MTETTENVEQNLIAHGATDLSYMSSGNDATFVKVIKEAAVFRYDINETLKVNASWTPASGKKPFGYFSEDGLTIHPESGDTTDFTAHNGDTALSMTSGGYWTFAFQGIESKKEVIETYFDTTTNSDGSLTVSSADCTTYSQYVIAGLTQDDSPIIIYVPKARISEREDITWNITNLQSFGMTLRAYKDNGYFFQWWGLTSSTSTSAVSD